MNRPTRHRTALTILGAAMSRRTLLQGVGAAATTLAMPAVHAQTLTKVPFQLSWIKTVQYGGLFAAQELGYFREVGIEPEWLSGGPNIDGVATVATGKAMIGDRSTDPLIIARGRNIPVKIIAAIYNRSPAALMSLSKAPILSLKDMVNKTIAASPNLRPVLVSLMRGADLDPGTVKFVPVGTDPGLLASGQVDGYVGMSSTQGTTLKKRGADIQTLHLSDIGARSYFCALFVNDKVLNDQPDLLRRFLVASIRGHQYMLSNFDQVLKWTLDTYGVPGLDAGEQAAEGRATIPYINMGEAGSKGLLWVEPSYLEPMIEVAVKSEMIPKSYPISDLVDSSIISAAHRPA